MSTFDELIATTVEWWSQGYYTLATTYADKLWKEAHDNGAYVPTMRNGA